MCRAVGVHELMNLRVFRILDVSAGGTVAAFAADIFQKVIKSRSIAGCQVAVNVLKADRMALHAFTIKLTPRGIPGFLGRSEGMRVRCFCHTANASA